MLTGLPPSVRWMRRALEQHEREMVLLRTLTNATPEEAEALRTRSPIALDRLNAALAAGDGLWWAWVENEFRGLRETPPR